MDDLHEEYVWILAEKHVTAMLFVRLIIRVYIEQIISMFVDPTYTQSVLSKCIRTWSLFLKIFTFDISVNETNKYILVLQYLFILLIYHNTSYTQRCDASSCAYFTKHLYFLLTTIVTVFKEILPKYCTATYSGNSANQKF